MVSATDMGRRGEFLAAYILETYGIEVHHVDRAGADLWCKVRGSIVTVQIKACSRPAPSSRQTKSAYYKFHTPNADSNWFGFAAMDRELLLMRPVSAVTSHTTRISPSEFNEANQRRTIEEMIESC